MIRIELSLRLPNNAGALAGVSRLLASEHVNVLAMALDTSGHLRIVVDNHVHGAAVLRERRHQVTEREVLVVETVSGLNALSRLAEAEINLNYSYGAAAAIVLGVDDALRASAASGI